MNKRKNPYFFLINLSDDHLPKIIIAKMYLVIIANEYMK